MSPNNLLKVFEDRQCFPHQAEFAASFFAHGSAQKHLLLSDPGLGKGVTSGAIVNHALATKLANRVLVLCPSVLTAQWSDIIRKGNPSAPVLAVNRERFRELEVERPESDSPWPSPAVVILSFDLAKRSDVADSLVAVKWDLLVVDEVQHVRMTNRRFGVIADLSRSSEVRVLLLKTREPGGQQESVPGSDLLFGDAAVTVWSQKTVTDRDGKPLLPEVRIEWIGYRRTHDEVAVLSRLRELLRPLTSGRQTTRLSAGLLMESASSSLFSLEQRLNFIVQRRNELAHGIGLGAEGETNPETANTRGAADSFDRQSELAHVALQLIPALDGVESDSKLEALLSLIRTIQPSSTGSRICVLTRFVDTASYLEAVLRENHLRVAKLTASASSADGAQILRDFDENGGVLIVTHSVESEMPKVTEVIFYDLPLNPTVLEARIGRFVRMGRADPVRVFAFTDESTTFGVEGLQKKVADAKTSLSDQELEDLFIFQENV